MVDSSFLIKRSKNWFFFNLPRLQRLAIIFMVLFISLALSLLKVTESRLIMLLGLLVGIGVVWLLYKSPEFGILLLVFSAIAVPISFGTGTGTQVGAPIILLVLLIGLWVLEMWGKRSIQLLGTRAILPLLALVLVAVLAFLGGQITWLFNAQNAPITTQVVGLAIFLLSVGTFLLVAHQVRDVKWLRWMTWVLLFLAGVIVLALLIPDLGSRIFRTIIPRSATGSVLWVWIWAISFSQAVFNRRLSRGSRLLLFGLFLGAVYVRLVIGQAWTSGWLPPLVAVIVILWVGAPRLALFISIFIGLLAMLSLPRIVDLIFVGDNVYSLDTRLAAWQIMLEIIKINPVLGLGPANYYWYTPIYAILGWNVNFNSHNNYVDILAQTGILGLLCFLWFMMEIGGIGWRLKTRVPEGFERAYVYGALGGIAGTLVAGMLGDWVIPFVYNVGLDGFRSAMIGWMFLGGLIVLERIYMSSEADSDPRTGTIRL